MVLTPALPRQLSADVTKISAGVGRCQENFGSVRQIGGRHTEIHTQMQTHRPHKCKHTHTHTATQMHICTNMIYTTFCRKKEMDLKLMDSGLHNAIWQHNAKHQPYPLHHLASRGWHTADPQ